MFKILFYAFLIYVLYKLIFDFIVPVSKATSQVKSKVREMQEQQRYQQQQAQQQQQKQTVTQSSQPKSDSDYIEFEEVK
jgi:hypothetical protein